MSDSKTKAELIFQAAKDDKAEIYLSAGDEKDINLICDQLDILLNTEETGEYAEWECDSEYENLLIWVGNKGIFIRDKQPQLDLY